jgi:hypothetical protein
MPNRFASGKHAIAECDRCGFRFKLRQLKSLVIKTKNVNILVCTECWEPDQPQLSLGLYFEPGNDGAGGSRMIQWGWAPIGGARADDAGLTPNKLVTGCEVGDVTVVVT